MGSSGRFAVHEQLAWNSWWVTSSVYVGLGLGVVGEPPLP